MEDKPKNEKKRTFFVEVEEAIVKELEVDNNTGNTMNDFKAKLRAAFRRKLAKHNYKFFDQETTYRKNDLKQLMAKRILNNKI